MKKIIFAISICCSQLLIQCGNGSDSNSKNISTDTAVIAAGKKSFGQNCSGCHDFVHAGIGPALGGITDEVPVQWLHDFIKDSKQVISSGDKRADSLFKQFKSVMPSFVNLNDGDLDAIIAFLHTNKSSPRLTKQTQQGISNPIPEKIKLSGLTVNLIPFAQFPASAKSGVFPKTRITKLGYEPGSGSLFINDLRGKLYKLKNGVPRTYLDISKQIHGFITEPGLATGFGSFAFHPDFAKNGLLYTTHTEAPGAVKADFRYNDSIKVTVQWVLTEWKVSDRSADTLKGTHRELLRIDMVSGAHGVQEIVFDPLSKQGDKDYGLLYIGIGDGASVQEGFPFLAHGKNKIYGAIIRIDPLGKNSANGKYGIPAGNPFFHDKDSGTIKEIYAYGFRNPHRLTWTKAGEMLACNVGQTNIESIYLINPGADYGWPIREGSFVMDPHSDLNNIFPLPADDSVYHITYPIVQFDHDEGNAISGGYEYWGNNISELKGKFLFGDIPSGRLFYINTADIQTKPVIREWKITINGTPKTLKEVCGSDRVDLHFGRDASGELYVLTKSDGKVYKIASAHMNPGN